MGLEFLLNVKQVTEGGHFNCFICLACDENLIQNSSELLLKNAFEYLEITQFIFTFILTNSRVLFLGTVNYTKNKRRNELTYMLVSAETL